MPETPAKSAKGECRADDEDTAYAAEAHEALTYECLAPIACRAPVNEDGIAVLPSDWDDDE